MSIQPVWSEEIIVQPYETDFQGRWKPAYFFQSMQRTASHHASNLGFDYHDMLRQNLVWVLSRTKIRFLHFPTLETRLTLRTWPKGIQQKIFFMRDFKFTAEDGQPVAIATSAWLLIDVEKRRMTVPKKLPGYLPDNEGLHALDEPLERIVPPEGLPEQLVRKAGYSAVDLMGHVNNARYVEWITDCFPFADYLNKRLSWLQINYSNEVKLGEQVSLAVGQGHDDPAFYVEGTNLSSGAAAFEAALGWTNAESPNHNASVSS